MNDVLYIKVKKLYRPENTCLDITRSKQVNNNELFWSNYGTYFNITLNSIKQQEN